MLTEEEKERIRAEEIFRYEIQQQLTNERKKDSRLWNIINSAFFLWFMSTIIVGVISVSYSNFVKNREDQRRKEEAAQIIEQEKRVAARKIDAEVSNRLYYFAQLSKFKEHDAPTNAIFILEKPSSVDYPVSVFPEFANRNLQSLLWELLQVVPESEKKEVDLAYKQAQQLSSMFLSENSLIAFNSNLPDFRSSLVKKFHSDAINNLFGEHQREQLQVFNLERWGKPLSLLYTNNNATEGQTVPNSNPK